MLSVAIMAHPSREEWAKTLSRSLSAPVVWDEKGDVWDTGRRALLAHSDTYHLVLQDDAVIPDGLVGECERLLEHTPDAPVSLYMGRFRHRPRRYPMAPIVDEGRAQGASFAVFGGPWWGVGIILPSAHIPDIVEYGDRGTHRNYDIRIAQYYASRRIDCWYTLPSLVEHREGPSIIGKRGAKRHAVWSLDGGPVGLDWGRGVVTPADLDLKQRFPKTP